MASLISPGIVIKERDLTNAVVTNASAISGAFASTFARGPVGEIVTISTQQELLDTFGKPNSTNAEDWFVASEFLNYGGRLAVVRAETSGLESAAAGAAGAVTVKNESDWEAGVGSGKDFVAKTPGKWGNSLKVVVVDRGPDQVVTLAGAPDTTPVVGSTVAFNEGGSTITATVEAYNAVTRELSIKTSTLITAAAELEDGNEILTFTHNGAVEAGRSPGTYNPPADLSGGASFEVVVGDAGVEAGGAATGVGGTVTVNQVNAGDGYSENQEIILPGSDTGNGSDIAVTVTALDPDIGVSSVRNWWTTTTVAGISLSSIGPRPGTSQFAADRGLSDDEIHIAVIDTTGDISGTAGTVIERSLYLSKLADGKGAEGQTAYWKSAINDGSQYVYAGATLDEATGAGEAWGQESTALSSGNAFKLGGALEYVLTGGDDDYDYSSGDITSAYGLFTSDEEASLDFVLMGGSMSEEVDTKAKAAAVMSVAMTRKDCLAFVSPHKGNQVGASGALTKLQQKTNTLNFFSTLSSTSYAVFDSGYKYMYDRFNDVYRWIPCNGDVAGLCVSTSATLDDWYSPAGTNRGGLRNAVKLAYNPTSADRDELYQARINPITSFAGSGIVLFGDKTALSAPSAFDRINVRRLFLNVQKRAETLAKGVLFEQNDATTRIGFASALNSYLSEVQARRGVTDFLVVCDESNNTPSVIDRNEFVAEIYMKPTRSINYITVTLTATKTGVSFSEVIGA